jgi:type I restriction enzyme S subunit
MISSAEYNDVTLKNVCGWLKLQLTGDGEVVKSITFKGNNGEQVAGELYINSAEATAILASDMGNVAVVDGKCAFNQQINAIVPKKYNSLFLYVLFQNTQSYAQSTVNMALKGILSKGKLEELEYILPPIELQNQFATFVQQIAKSKFAVQKSLEKAETLYKSLMQEYFG